MALPSKRALAKARGMSHPMGRKQKVGTECLLLSETSWYRLHRCPQGPQARMGMSAALGDIKALGCAGSP